MRLPKILVLTLDCSGASSSSLLLLPLRLRRAALAPRPEVRSAVGAIPPFLPPSFGGGGRPLLAPPCLHVPPRARLQRCRVARVLRLVQLFAVRRRRRGLQVSFSGRIQAAFLPPWPTGCS